MATERLEVRLDVEHRRRLKVLAEEHGTPASDLVRQLIDRAYEDSLKARRLRAAFELGEMNLEDLPDPETLSKELAAAHDPGLP
ncbi:MAG: hypothetical protein FJ319_04205 [SAR202 cluster bacterium]|nr:hypothetical protein [SAR202 cluster bacterium]